MKPVIALVFLGLLCEAASDTPCNASKECPANYCCVSKTRPIGKRRQVLAEAQGTCQPLGQNNDGCLVRTGAYTGEQMYFSCPCASGLTCKGNGMIDIPLGETGSCVHS